VRNLSSKALGFALVASTFVAGAASAQAVSPWTPSAGSFEGEVAYTNQTADRFYAGNVKSPLPAELALDTIGVSASYGVTEQLAIDVSFGYGQSDFIVAPGLAPKGGLEGFSDITIGGRYKFLDQVDGAPVTLTVAVAAIIAGDYDTGALPAIGDGGSGGQVSGAIGWQNGPFSVNGSVGFRARGNDVPDETFGGVNANIALGDRFSVYAGLGFVDSDGKLDIGAPGFSPARFPEVQEDYSFWSVGGSASLVGNTSINLSYGRKFDGRNTAISDFTRLGLGFGF
jgi:hypothetical protein